VPHYRTDLTEKQWHIINGVVIDAVVKAGRADVEGGTGAMCCRSPARSKTIRLEPLKLGDRLGYTPD